MTVLDWKTRQKIREDEVAAALEKIINERDTWNDHTPSLAYAALTLHRLLTSVKHVNLSDWAETWHRRAQLLRELHNFIDPSAPRMRVRSRMVIDEEIRQKRCKPEAT